MYVCKLKEMFEKTRLTKQQLSELSGVPLSTIKRIFSGETPSPQFQTVVDLVRAMGGSLDEFCEFPKPEVEVDTIPSPTVELISAYQDTIADKTKQIEDKEKVAEDKEQMISDKDNQLSFYRKIITSLIALLSVSVASWIVLLAAVVVS